MLDPRDAQTINLPTNLVVESSIDIAAENAEFYRRSASGVESRISGNISKRRFGSIFQYTLGWGEAGKPKTGSYDIYAKISGEQSSEITVKIQ